LLIIEHKEPSMMVKLDYFFEAVVSVSLPIISSFTMVFAFDQLLLMVTC
jgi:hypothetical protein